ncbi:MAG: large conductance mechanosensitive channel protein MscL [Pseudomonadota bacterium]|jgi:large conductance mechanosensitive channel
MFKEFKEFALKGNVIDLAIGVIVGGAFGKIVDAMVGDLIMPLVSMLIGHLDFSNYFIALAHVPDQVPLTLDALKKAGIPVFAYGNFITVAVNFLILAFVIFLMVKQINRLKRSETAAPAAAEVVTPEDILLLREIRDQLKR